MSKYSRIASNIPAESSAWFVYGILLIIGFLSYISTIMVPDIDNDDYDSNDSDNDNNNNDDDDDDNDDKR